MQLRSGGTTLAAFLEWEAAQDAKHELVHGQIVAFSGASKDQNHIAGNVYIALCAGVRPPCTAYGSDMIVETISRTADNGYRPDAVVSCSEADRAGTDRYLKFPRIVVEVRSPRSDVGTVWETKLLEYSSTPVIEQLVLIEAESRAVASYLRDAAGGWQPPIVTIGNGTLVFASIDLTMTLDDVYRRTTLDGGR